MGPSIDAPELIGFQTFVDTSGMENITHLKMPVHSSYQQRNCTRKLHIGGKCREISSTESDQNRCTRGSQVDSPINPVTNNSNAMQYVHPFLQSTLLAVSHHQPPSGLARCCLACDLLHFLERTPLPNRLTLGSRNSLMWRTANA